jgi:DNA-binding HxlR family transcriptional regulator
LGSYLVYHQWSPDVRALNLIGAQWTLLIVRDLSVRPKRWHELRSSLPGIPEALLTERLVGLVENGLATRAPYPEHRAGVQYELTAAGRALAPVLAELARWGYRNCWGEPMPGERVDVAAALRLAGGLLVGMPDGDVLVRVIGPARARFELLVSADDGRVAVTEVAQRPARVDAQVAGYERDWITFLARRRVDVLQIVGDRALAVVMLQRLMSRKGPKR